MTTARTFFGALLLGLLLGSLLHPAPASAQFIAHATRLSLDGDLLSLRKLDLEGGDLDGQERSEFGIGLGASGPGLGLSHAFSEKVVLGVRVAGRRNTNEVEGGSETRGSLSVEAGGRYVALSGTVRPFLGVSVGVQRLHVETSPAMEKGETFTGRHFVVRGELGAHLFATRYLSVDPSLGVGYTTGGGIGARDPDESGLAVRLNLALSVWFGGATRQRPQSASQKKAATAKDSGRDADAVPPRVAATTTLRSRHNLRGWVLGLEGNAEEQSDTITMGIAERADSARWARCPITLHNGPRKSVLATRHQAGDGRQQVAAYASVKRLQRWLAGKRPSIGLCNERRYVGSKVELRLRSQLNAFARGMEQNGIAAQRAKAGAGPFTVGLRAKPGSNLVRVAIAHEAPRASWKACAVRLGNREGMQVEASSLSHRQAGRDGRQFEQVSWDAEVVALQRWARGKALWVEVCEQRQSVHPWEGENLRRMVLQLDVEPAPDASSAPAPAQQQPEESATTPTSPSADGDASAEGP